MRRTWVSACLQEGMSHAGALLIKSYPSPGGGVLRQLFRKRQPGRCWRAGRRQRDGCLTDQRTFLCPSGPDCRGTGCQGDGEHRGPCGGIYLVAPLTSVNLLMPVAQSGPQPGCLAAKSGAYMSDLCWSLGNQAGSLLSLSRPLWQAGAHFGHFGLGRQVGWSIGATIPHFSVQGQSLQQFLGCVFLQSNNITVLLLYRLQSARDYGAPPSSDRRSADKSRVARQQCCKESYEKLRKVIQIPSVRSLSM